MLVELRLKDFGLADTLTLEPASGLVAITGETGAGKSLLVNAIAFVTGSKSQGEWVRTGADRAEVTAVFDTARVTGLEEWLEEKERTLVFRREWTQQGKGRAWINDRPVTVAALKRAGRLLCDLHSQHEHQALTVPEEHAVFLDAFLTGSERTDYVRAYEAWMASRAALTLHEEKRKSDLSQKDFWEFQIQELERINPRSGEYEELEARRALLKSQGQWVDLERALAAELDGTEDSLIPRLSRVVRQLQRAALDHPPLATSAGLAEEALRLLGEASTRSSSFGEVAEEEYSLEAIESRLHALYNLKKKFGGSLENAVEQRHHISENLKFLEQSQARAQELALLERRAKKALEEVGGTLTVARKDATSRMRQALRSPLSELGLGKDPLTVQETPLALDAWTASGPSTIEFMLAANPGEAPKPLAKIASGGELSRLMLGLKSVLPASRGVETLIFDEIDSGIGGETAARVGKRLLALAQGRQVLVITHLPQIATHATQHLEVKKRMRGGRHVPEVFRLEPAEREAALDRMMAGFKQGGAPTPADGEWGAG